MADLADLEDWAGRHGREPSALGVIVGDRVGMLVTTGAVGAVGTGACVGVAVFGCPVGSIQTVGLAVPVPGVNVGVAGTLVGTRLGRVERVGA